MIYYCKRAKNGFLSAIFMKTFPEMAALGKKRSLKRS